MDDVVIRSMLKWPDVPDVFGWLRLDRRGNWRVRGASEGREPVFGTVGNRALKAFIDRNYACDERGRWFFQNGPQRVFVQLAYAPFVFRIDRGAVTDADDVQIHAIRFGQALDDGLKKTARGAPKRTRLLRILTRSEHELAILELDLDMAGNVHLAFAELALGQNALAGELDLDAAGDRDGITTDARQFEFLRSA